MSSSTEDKSYRAFLTTIGVDPSALLLNSDGTIVDAPGGTSSSLSLRLPVLNTEDCDGAPTDVRMTQVLGEGGMGRVHAAEQVALQREVAVKILHAGLGTQGAEELLREALIVARLEHPNIIPVYLLGRSPEGRPMLVMKRVEGVSWGAVLDGVSVAPGIFSGTHDPLEFHSGVFLKVCEAVQFAHARGILHRDLKPDNVMLGSFGEVYVLDWGIAVSLEEDPHLPLAREVRSVAGTPAYMAPEMASASPLSVRTDVYLLGAVLHHVLTGQPPHRGTTIIEQLEHAFAARTPTFDSTVPEDLAAVCAKAMQRVPSERFASVDELRRAVQDCLHHRSSWLLAQEAERRAEALRALLSQGEVSREGSSAVRVQQLFSECRFGYLQALAGWEANPLALQGLRTVLVAMIEYELSRENPRVAAELLAQVSEPSEELSQRVKNGLRESEAEVARIAQLEQFQRQADVRWGQRTRAAAAMAVGALWGLVSLLVGWLDRTGRFRFGYPEAVTAAVVFALSQAGGSLYVHRKTQGTIVQAKLLGVAVMTAFSFIGHWCVCWYLGVPLQNAMVLFLLWVSGGWVMGGILVDRRVIPSGIVFGVTGLAILAFPSLRFELLGLALIAAYLALWANWREGRLGEQPASTPG